MVLVRVARSMCLPGGLGTVNFIKAWPKRHNPEAREQFGHVIDGEIRADQINALSRLQLVQIYQLWKAKIAVEVGGELLGEGPFRRRRGVRIHQERSKIALIPQLRFRASNIECLIDTAEYGRRI